jgi:exportin-2 (importin alpha re-exporter)
MMESLLKLLILPLAITKTTSAADEEVEIADLDEAAAGLGYQASFSKLGASEKPKEDPVAWCKDPKEWLAKGLQGASSSQPGKVSQESPTVRRRIEH